jgi:hypothetical protein
MEFTDYLWIKAIVLVVIAFVIGLIHGWRGQGQNEKEL